MSEATDRKGFLGYEQALEDEVFALLGAEYPERNVTLIAPMWRWMFVQSAKRLGQNPKVWLYRKSGSVVAHQGALCVRLLVNGDETVTGWFVETISSSGVRGTPIGPMVIKKALEELPFNLSLGQTEQMRQLQYAMGWKRVGVLKKYVFVSGYKMNLRNKLPPLVAQVAAAAIGLKHYWRWRILHNRIPADFETKLLSEFTDEHDCLWDRMAKTCTCAVIRDASYMNWKYIERPNGQFRCLQISVAGAVQGVVVLMMSEASDVYPYRRGYLVDFVVPLNKPAIISALIAEGIRNLRAQGAQTVTCQAISSRLCAVLEAYEFFARESRHQFLVAVGTNSQDNASELLSADNWYLTLGDSDADFYAD